MIKQIPTETNEAERNEKKKTDEAKAELDRKLVEFNGDLAYYTKILAIVAILQFIALCVQAFVFIRTLRATEIAANAAKDSADALPAIERAYVFVVPKIKPVLLADGKFGVEYYFVNHGKTPAVIDGIEIHFSPLASPPDNTSFLANIPQANGSVIGTGERWPSSQDGIINPSAETASITGEAIELNWFHGTITYTDVFGRARHTRFRWRFEFNGETYSFTPDGGAPYNERT